jgi:hypothetical protein
MPTAIRSAFKLINRSEGPSIQILRSMSDCARCPTFVPVLLKVSNRYASLSEELAALRAR